MLARPGSGKEAELYGAFTRGGPANGGGVSYYTFEYTIRTDKWYRHNMVGLRGILSYDCTFKFTTCTATLRDLHTLRIQLPIPCESALFQPLRL